MEAHCQCGERPRDWSHWADHAAEALISAPDLAIVELPDFNGRSSVVVGGEPESVYLRWEPFDGEEVITISGYVNVYVSEARALAAALLAAAAASESAER